MRTHGVVEDLPRYGLTDTAGMVQALQRDGFAFVPGVLAPGGVRELREAMDRLRPFGFDGINEVQEHYKCVFNRDRVFLPLTDRPGIVDLARAVMGAQCHVMGMTAWRSHPGYDGRGMHLDELLVPLPESVFDDPEFHVPALLATAHYYLDEVDIDLCPTWVVPGSHRAGRRPDRDADSWRGQPEIPVLCRPGDVLFFRSELWHRGSVNRSDRARHLVQVHYSHRAIAQKFSPWPFQYNPEILAIATPAQRVLLGDHPESNYG